MKDKITLFWFRQDLRLSDNPGLFHAAQNGVVLPVYILDDSSKDKYKMGGASRWWLNQSLHQLNESLDKKLNIYIGDPKEILFKIIKNNRIGAVYWNRCYEPWRVKNDAEIETLLKNNNIECKSFNAALLKEPWEVLKEDKTSYKVYGAFYKKSQISSGLPRALLPTPKKLQLIQDDRNKHTFNHLFSSEKWHKTLESHWQVGEKAAQKKIKSFIKNGLLDYKEGRDYPAKPNTSRLSPHLHFGEISPHQVWQAIQVKKQESSYLSDVEHFTKELAWREFSYHLLYHFPSLPYKNFQSKFDHFPWQSNIPLLKAWQAGKTGYPIIDAGMRELWQTGYMHNRVRMIVGSFLVKNCLIHWHQGEAWFWDCLVDADLANNSASWQWIAGSGADAAPYFRIFNPVTQGEKFDPQGEYTCRFVPELAKLPKRFLFKPWEAPEAVLKASGVKLGKNYPKPVVDLKTSRLQAMEAYGKIKS